MALPRVNVVEAARNRRVMRRPQHPFHIRSVPFAITPFFIAPVLPGETMKNLNFQVRAVTDPVKNPLIGWWTEYYFFYVKLRDLDERELITDMVLNPQYDPTALIAQTSGTTALAHHYYAGGAGQVNWVQLTTRRIIQEYFRDEGDDWTMHSFNDGTLYYASAQISGNSVMDSIRQADDITAQDVEITVGADDKVAASEIDQAMRNWELLRLHNLTEMSFEDYLSSFGIRQQQIELHRPELIRYVREWSYPSNTIDPTNGTPRSALSWTVAERADKDRFFNEPGFLVGVNVVRPKVYLRNQKGTFTSALNDMFAWLPRILEADNRASWKRLADNVGPLQAATDTDGYWFDVKDLFLYGEQFIGGFSTADTDKNFVPLPSATLENKRYVTDIAQVKEFFVSDTAYYCRQDGIVSLQIASSLRDTSPRGGPATAV